MIIPCMDAIQTDSNVLEIRTDINNMHVSVSREMSFGHPNLNTAAHLDRSSSPEKKNLIDVPNQPNL